MQAFASMASSSASPVYRSLRVTGLMIGCLFIVLAIQVLAGLPLFKYGIWPRTVIGLRGILFSPLLHVNLKHLLANAMPLFVLLLLVQSDRAYRPGATLACIWAASGFGTWLIGRPALHIGASGIIFGLVAFLLVAGFRLKRWQPAIVSFLVFLLYGGIFYGALPQAGPVSWEGHLCGAVAGAWRATRIRA